MLCSRREIHADSGRGSGRRKSLLLAVGVAVALWLLVFAPDLSGMASFQEAEACDAPGAVRFLPESAVVDVGRMVTVELWLEGGAHYYGLDVRVAFDPALVQVSAGRVTPLWEVFDALNHFTLKNEANNVSGAIWYAVTNTNPSEPFTGSGRVFSLAFTGVASGTTPLHVTYAKGSTRDGVGLFPATVDGSITVQVRELQVVSLPLIVRLFAKP